jgi:SAM-dependent methyltransferase
MHEILRTLSPGAVVLDLGCGGGSFESGEIPLTVVRIDLERPSPAPRDFVQANAAQLPFADSQFAAVISNHSLEHFDDLQGALAEIGRILKPEGALYVAVPDSSTFQDRLYRSLASGGGHVNPFSSSKELAAVIERATGLKHVATRTLCTSLSYLNRKNRRTRAPRRLLLLGGGTEASLFLFSGAARLLDRWFGTRASVYGWALYFGKVESPIELDTWTNVCLRCGSGFPSQWLLRDRQLVKRRFLVPTFRCPQCSALNIFTHDRS